MIRLRTICKYLGLSIVVGSTVIIENETQAAVPANLQAMPEAKKLLNYLEALPNRSPQRFVLGQQAHMYKVEDKDFSRDMKPLLDKHGKWPALIGGDYMHWESPEPSIPGNQNNLISYWKKGGLVTISIHMRNPWSSGQTDSWYTSNANINDLLRAGSQSNRWYMKELDRLAEGLKEMNEKGVVVLWRPFHEPPGRFFWWNADGRDNYKKLWRHMFEYFTYTKKLNNLLWVWSAFVMWNNEDQIPWYPGNNYVDIVALDNYQDVFNNSNMRNAYNRLIGLGKPFAIAETGCGYKQPCPTDYSKYLDAIRKEYNKTTYVMFWGQGHAIHRSTNSEGVVNHSSAITLDTLDWRDAGGGEQRPRQPMKPQLTIGLP